VNRYVTLVCGSLRAIGRLGKWTVLGLLAVVCVIVGVVAFMAIGGMGLALMGTAIGIGPVGWIAIVVLFALAAYGAVRLLRR
jgi:hypothetical protein